MRTIRTYNNIIALLVAVVLMAFLPALLHIMGYIPDKEYINNEIHTFLETFGAIFNLLITVIIYFRYKSEVDELDYPIIGISFLFMGLFDGYHAVVSHESVFVFSHIISVFFGGISFGILIFPGKIKKSFRNKATLAIIFLLWLLIVFYMTLFPEYIPAMIKDGRFTIFTDILNLLAFVGFVSGTIWLISRYRKNNEYEILFIALVGLVQGMSRLTFSFSEIYQVEWWIWHLYRFAGSGIILYIVLRTFNNLISQNALSIKNLQTIIDNLPVGVVIIGMDRKIRQINKTAEKMTGFSSDEYTGSHCYNSIFSTSCSACPAIESTTGISNERKDLRKKDGSALPVLNSITPIELDGIPVLMESFIDIRELKATEKKLRETMHFLEQSHYDLEQLTNIAAHDLQEPLRKITYYLDVVSRELNPDHKDSTNKHFKALKKNTSKLRSQILAMHSVTLLTTKSLSAEDIELDNIVNHLLEESFQHMECSHPPLPKIYADEKLITLLFYELFSNANKFHSEKHPKVNISFGEIGDFWKFEVKDNGIGFEQQYESKIFTAFEKLQNKYKYPGEGVGLTKCKKIVVLHGGNIWAKSSPGTGSAFHFTIAKGVKIVDLTNPAEL